MDQANEAVISSGSEEFWKGHILAAQPFSGTNREYCRRNNLNHRIFSYKKRRLGFGRPRSLPKVFIEVKSKIEDVEKAVREPKKTLPDAKWLAEFALTLLSAQK